MTRRPILLVAGLAAGCTAPGLSSSPPAPAAARYRALGQEPGWSLVIEHGTISYVGDYGDVRITVPAPSPRTSFNGHRYEAGRLTVDITHSLCNDAMSGRAFADRVMVIADGRTVHGCGGERRPDKDM
jgi:heat shock protein HslJ